MYVFQGSRAISRDFGSMWKWGNTSNNHNYTKGIQEIGGSAYYV